MPTPAPISLAAVPQSYGVGVPGFDRLRGSLAACCFVTLFRIVSSLAGTSLRRPFTRMAWQRYASFL